MFERFRLLLRLPNYALLSWRLFRDPRVPSAAKAMTVGAIALIMSPIDLLDWIPLAGQAGELVLITMVLRAFINAAPDFVREEHMGVLGMRDV